MKFFCSTILFLLVLSNSVVAQQNHFLFVQSESRQPFNITLNKKVYSSTATGYLIIPKLSSGQYDIEVGFAQNTFPEQHFTVEIKQKDVGFNLKNFGDKGWGLFNLQTMDVTMAKEAGSAGNVASTLENKMPNANIVEAQQKGTPTFQPEINKKAETLQDVDTAPAIQAQQKKDEPKRTVLSQPVDQKPEDQPNIGNNPAYQQVQVPAEAKPPASQKVQTANQATVKPNASFQNKIIKISEMKGGEAIYMTYVDITANGRDTIDLLIPNATLTAETPAKNNKAGDLKFLDIETRPNSQEAKSNTATPVAQVENDANTAQDVAPVARNCPSVATNDDFLKLRKKMAAANDNDEMVYEARKVFKNQCFTTEQVKNLAYLFLTDQSRYQFFDAAYPFVSDPANFPPLAIMLTNEYYINRFKTMLRN